MLSPFLSQDPEKVIQDLKLKLARKAQVIEDLSNQDESSGPRDDGISSRLKALHDEVNNYIINYIIIVVINPSVLIRTWQVV